MKSCDFERLGNVQTRLLYFYVFQTGLEDEDSG